MGRSFPPLPDGKKIIDNITDGEGKALIIFNLTFPKYFIDNITDGQGLFYYIIPGDRKWILNQSSFLRARAYI